MRAAAVPKEILAHHSRKDRAMQAKIPRTIFRRSWLVLDIEGLDGESSVPERNSRVGTATSSDVSKL